MDKSSAFAPTQARHLMQCWSAQKNYAPIPVAATQGCWIHTTDGRRNWGLNTAIYQDVQARGNKG